MAHHTKHPCRRGDGWFTHRLHRDVFSLRKHGFKAGIKHFYRALKHFGRKKRVR